MHRDPTERLAERDAAETLAIQRLAYRSEAEIYGDDTLRPLAESLGELSAALQRCLFLGVRRDDALVGAVRVRKRKTPATSAA